MNSYLIYHCDKKLSCPSESSQKFSPFGGEIEKRNREVLGKGKEKINRYKNRYKLVTKKPLKFH